MNICLICLRTDRLIKLSNGLSQFHDELCGYTLLVAKTFYCGECEYLLTKFYKFKQKCLKASEIYRDWISGEIKDPIHALHKRLPPSSLGMWIANPKTVSEVKLEATTLPHVRKANPKTLSETKLEATTLPHVRKANPKTVSETKLEATTLPHVSKANPKTVSETKLEATTLPHVRKANPKTVSETKLEATTLPHVRKANPKTVSETKLEATTLPHVCTKKEKKNMDCYSTLQELLKNAYIKEVKSGCDPIYSIDSSDDDVQNENDSVNIQETLTTNNYKVIENDETLVNDENDVPQNDNNSNSLQEISTSKNGKTTKNYKSYESMFDIEYLTTHEMKVAEFQRRKTYECYVNAEHKCEICYQVVKSAKFLKYHKDNRHKESPDRICCPICKIWYPKNGYQNRHRHTAVFKCKLCPLVTYYSKSMENHFEWHEGKKYHCEECNVTYKSRSALNSHIGKVHRLGTNICERCGRGFRSPLGLIFHKKHSYRCTVLEETAVPEETESVRCDECDVTLPSQQVYNAHVSDVHMPKSVGRSLPPSSTGLPGYMISKNCNRKQRRCVRYKPPKHTCRVCNEVGVSTGWLNLHFKREHPNEDMNILYADKKKHLCDVCGTGFSSPYLLRDHMNNHTGARPYACDICSKQFSTQMRMQDHRLRHFPATLSCTHCEKTFKTKSNLYTHMKSHTGERSYRCNICGKGFLLSTSLNEHVQGVHLHIRRARKRDAKTEAGAEKLSKKRNKVLEIEAIETSEVIETETIDASEILETEVIDASEVFETETIDANEVFDTQTIDASEVFETETIDAREELETETIDSNCSEIYEIEALDSSEEFETEIIDTMEVYETKTLDASEIYQTDTIDAS